MDVADSSRPTTSAAVCCKTFFERDRINDLLNTKGILLRTSVLSTEEDTKPVLNRTLLFDYNIYEHPIAPYVPPVFLLIMYERTPYRRYDCGENDRIQIVKHAVDSARTYETVREKTKRKETRINSTDVVLMENKLLIKELLRLADCLPDSMRHCFLRLEHAGSLQSMFAETFPTPALKIGCLARLTFKSLRKRDCALAMLSDNAASNSDMYAINRSSNECATTVTRYLEPLFRHALELQTAWSLDPETKPDELYNDNGVFDVNFHLLDFEQRTTAEDERKDGPIFFVGTSDARGDGSQQTRTAIKEKTSRISPLTIHDVSRFYQHPIFNQNGNGGSELQSLPVVYVRCEIDFICLSACTESNRRNVLFHIYYVWNRRTADVLTDIATIVNSSTNYDTCTVRMSVCDVFENRISAYVKMVDDAKTCFWKKFSNTYIRLVLDSTRDCLLYSRFVLHDLLTQEISSSKVSLQSRIEGSRDAADGSVNMFPNSIALDCSKLVEDLDGARSKFAAAYKRNLQDALAYHNGYGLSENVLALRQEYVNDLLLQFKTERIAELSYTLADEMYLGILDLYGVERGKNVTRCDHVSNYLFVQTLVNESVYTSSTTFDTDLRALVKKNNTEDDSSLIPASCASFQEGIHCTQEDKEILEFDMESALPSIMETFNVSPETTVIMRKTDLEKIEKNLIGIVKSNDEERFTLDRWYFVVPYVDSPDELVIVSLIPYVYKGCMGGVFKSLILKRRTCKEIAAYFYKRLANRISGCMGRKGSDLFAVHCLAAASSLCRTIMTKTLDSLKNTVKVLRLQTDGGLVQATRKTDWLAADLQLAFSDCIDILLNRPHTNFSAADSLLRLRVRNVNMCFIAKQTKYAIRYADDEKQLKGRSGNFVVTARAEAAVTDAIIELVDIILQPSYECRCEDVLNTLMRGVCERISSDSFNNHVDHDGFYFLERILPFDDIREEEKTLDLNELRYNQHCRFGDTAPLWPVIKIEGDRILRYYICMPNNLRSPVIVDKFGVLRFLINEWAFELCRSQCYDFRIDTQCEGNYTKLFYSKLMIAGNVYANKIHQRRFAESLG